MGELVLASAFLLASHFGISSTGLRPWLIQRLGAGPYLGAYSVLALIAIFWLASAYNRADTVVLWSPSPWQALVPLVIMPIALLLLVGALTTANPTIVGRALVSKKIDPPEGVLRITRHPTMWAFGLWALSHLTANGDLASLVLFGTIAALALIGTLLIDARYRERLGTLWQPFSDQTSNLPFAAIMTGRQKLDLGEIGWWRAAAALGLFVVLLALHSLIFGVSATGIA